MAGWGGAGHTHGHHINDRIVDVRSAINNRKHGERRGSQGGGGGGVQGRLTPRRGGSARALRLSFRVFLAAAGRGSRSFSGVSLQPPLRTFHPPPPRYTKIPGYYTRAYTRANNVVRLRVRRLFSTFSAVPETTASPTPPLR